MTEPLTTRGPWVGGGFAVAWMLKSGQPDRGTQDGIRLTLIDEDQTSRPGIVSRVLSREDAEDLYVQLGKHLDNTVPPVPNIDGDGRDGVIPGVTDFRESNLKAIQDEIDNPLTFNDPDPSPVQPGTGRITEGEVLGWTDEEAKAAFRNSRWQNGHKDVSTGRKYTPNARRALLYRCGPEATPTD